MHPQRANIPLQGIDRCALAVGAISGPQAKFEVSFSAISPVVGFTWSARSTLVKADQLTLASGDSEHAYMVTISWGNKMNFRLCCEQVGFLLRQSLMS